MIALGTGIAPMRALIQERVSAKKRGEPIGPMTLIFGSRTKTGDFLYEDEIQMYKDQGII
jgi:sulfite reductase alpha subunit-like flavoprotein